MSEGQQIISARKPASPPTSRLDDILAAARHRILPNSLPLSITRPLVERIDGLPSWWAANGNILLCSPSAVLPDLKAYDSLPAPTNARIILACKTAPTELILWGDGPTILIGARAQLPGARLSCGGGSTIIVGDRTSSTWDAQIDCRNGGLVLVGEDGMWASNVQINSDDMHAIRDLDGKRLNAFGGTIIIGPRVWLAFQSLVLNGAHIGHDTVVGARSVVTGELPSNAVCAGMPARVVKTGTRWEVADNP